jgi:hypothetical protein
MDRKFINMYMEQTAYGYWRVDFINESGDFDSRIFENDLEAHEFYMELINNK